MQTVISEDHVDALGLGAYMKPPKRKGYIGVGGQEVRILGRVNITWCTVKAKKWLVDDEWLVVKGLPYDAVIGTDRWYEVRDSLPDGVLGDVKKVEAEDKGGEYSLSRNNSTNEIELVSESPIMFKRRVSEFGTHVRPSEVPPLPRQAHIAMTSQPQLQYYLSHQSDSSIGTGYSGMSNGVEQRARPWHSSYPEHTQPTVHTRTNPQYQNLHEEESSDEEEEEDEESSGDDEDEESSDDEEDEDDEEEEGYDNEGYKYPRATRNSFEMPQPPRVRSYSYGQAVSSRDRPTATYSVSTGLTSHRVHPERENRQYDLAHGNGSTVAHSTPWQYSEHYGRWYSDYYSGNGML